MCRALGKMHVSVGHTFVGALVPSALASQCFWGLQVSAERLAALNPRLYNFQVGNFDYTDEELHLGQLQGISLHALSTCLHPQNLLLSAGVEHRQNSLSFAASYHSSTM